MTTPILTHPSSTRPDAPLRIITAAEPIPVDYPVMLMFGQPGICKTSLAYSADRPLLLDCDQGAHRAVNRGDTLAIASWADVEALTGNPRALDPYQTIVVDTVGRLLDLLTLDIIDQTPKYARDGSLTQQGWGVLKGRFRTWLTRLKAMRKYPLLVAHAREDKDGDVTQVRPDIQGGSYGEVLKSADFVGYVAMLGKARVLDFSPTDRWVGKNPAGWRPITIPPADQATRVIADLFDRGRQTLGQISMAAAQVAEVVATWRTAIEVYTTVEEINGAFARLDGQPPLVQVQVKKALHDRAKARGFVADVTNKQYRAPVAATATTTIAAEVVW